MDNRIYSKLTESAKTALDETVKEVADKIVEKAYKNASFNSTADKEISLRDIIEAKEDILYKKNEIRTVDSKKKRLTLMLSMTGAVYAVVGILLYLYQNKSFDMTKDLGLIVAALGILISIIAFYYTQLLTKRKVELIKDNTVIERETSDFEIVRRWQVIEKLGTDLMLKEGFSDKRAKSINFIFDYLSEKLSNTLNEVKLKKILLARNQIVHNGITMSKEEVEKILKTADEIIDELEKQTK